MFTWALSASDVQILTLEDASSSDVQILTHEELESTAPLFLCWPPPQRRQVPPLCPARVALRLSPHCNLRSLSPVRGSLSLAALLKFVPIGPPSFCEEVLQGRVSKLKESLVLLHEMGDSHLEATLPPQVFLCHSHLSSLPRQPSLFKC